MDRLSLPSPSLERFDVLSPTYPHIPLGTTELRSVCHAQGLWHACVHIWVLHSSTGKILVQRRAAVKDSFPNCWDVSCAGHLSAGETKETAALAELKEELGLSALICESPPSPLPLTVGVLHHFTSIPRTVVSQQGKFIDNEFTHCLYYIFDVERDKIFTLQEDEVEEVKWMDPFDLKEAIRRGKGNDREKEGKETKKGGDGGRREEENKDAFVVFPDFERYWEEVFSPILKVRERLMEKLK